MLFSMIGELSDCLLLSYRTPAETVRQLVPSGLELVTYRNWAFWNIVVCKITAMRPQGFPPVVGVNYIHVAYRLMVRGTSKSGAECEGLYFVRSDCNHRVLSAVGNWMTDFKFHYADIYFNSGPCDVQLSVKSSQTEGVAELLTRANASPTLLLGSCFRSFEEAAHFLKYRPVGIACRQNGAFKLARVERDEMKWDEKPIRVVQSKWSFLDHLGQGEAQLEMASRVAPIDYRWILGGE